MGMLVIYLDLTYVQSNHSLMVPLPSAGAQALYSAGARNFLYISITPLGCIPFILSTRNGAKDADGCYEPYNELSYLHGTMLHAEIKDLRIQHPDASFTFLDYYGVYQHILENHAAFGKANPHIWGHSCFFGRPNRDRSD